MPINAESVEKEKKQGHRRDDSTDLALFVRTSQDDMTGWDRHRIVDALLRETYIDRDTAEKISIEVENTIQTGKVKTITGPLIREMVNAKLLEMGLESARRMHTRLGVPLYDVDNLLVQHNKENANVPHGPEATNLTLAEGIKKEYALLHVFTPDVADAHLRGDLHLHDLGFIDRPYCSGQSLEYIKKFGLNLPHALSAAKPAKHAEILLAHMVKFAAALQSHFAGAIGWDAVNLFYAPYLEELTDKQVHQLAQMLIYEFSQQAVARGGQAIFSDINIYWEVPKHFVDVPAIGPGGEYTGKTYGEYEKQAQRFAWALFEVYKEGDAQGRPFFFPKPLVHITEKLFKTEGHREFLNHICEVASVKGNTYFVFDRGETAKISECCRLSFKLEAQDIEDAKKPWKMRYSALQNVTINLPRLAYQAKGDDTMLFQLLTERIQLAAKAHEQKKKFIEKLMSMGTNGPLALLAMNHDGEAYLKLHKCSYLIGMVGLNELIKVHIGDELHQTEAAIKFGLKVIAHMNIVCNKMAEALDMKFVLEQTPAESTSFRFARLDMAHHRKDAEKVIQGNRETGEIYYSNSTLFNVGAQMSPISRVEREGLFHPLIEAGSITHLWLGEAQPDKEALANFVTNVFKHTQNDQIAFSPEFTCCLDCGKTSRGLVDNCPYCNSENVDGITRITGYFTKISSWNKGKLGELHDRYRNVNRFNN
ncbi:MAG: anaerobic ribonucleoside-triphosphate reductase [Desulfobulbaceae bacterium]|nr:anaerobic ribonucleoside-triphosphate reductase [Desulfobulbaceae bacterium]HIJ79019.1 anaerobic ribonucleoside-triphosphate reductase [Deltaproteobacteria bacterium]